MNLKICIAQTEVKPGFPQKNTTKMLEMIEGAKKDGADIICFPEMVIGGYLLGDVWERSSFLRECQACNDKIRQASRGQNTKDIVVVWGNIDVDWDKKNEDGRVRKYNACFVAENGNYVQQVGTKRFTAIKTLMPEYREFEDNRHFYSYRKVMQDETIDFVDAYEPFILKNGLKVGCMLCEDAWDTDYEMSPMEILAPKSDLIINLSCSPFTEGKNGKRDRVFSKHAKTYKKPMVYVNCVGIQDNGKTVYSFDGDSCIYDKAGNRNDIGSPFEDVAKTVGFDLEGVFKATVQSKDDIGKLYASIKYTTKKFMERLNINKVVIGASGGIDSALVSAIMSEILPKENILLVNMPSRYNSDLTKDAAKKLAENLGCNYAVTPIEESIRTTNAQIRFALEGFKLTPFMLENVQARDRSSRVLAGWAALFGGVFTCNANKSEMTVGYSTLYGDLSGFLAPISDLWKTQVYEMARWFNKNIKDIIPKESIDVVPSAELSSEQDVTKGKGDPIRYDYHDLLFKSWVERWDRATPEDILVWLSDFRLEKELGWFHKASILCTFDYDYAEFIADLERWWNCFQGMGIAKRVQAPPVIAVSRRSFGYDMRESQLGVQYSEKYYELKDMFLKIGKVKLASSNID